MIASYHNFSCKLMKCDFELDVRWLRGGDMPRGPLLNLIEACK